MATWPGGGAGTVYWSGCGVGGRRGRRVGGRVAVRRRATGVKGRFRDRHIIPSLLGLAGHTPRQSSRACAPLRLMLNSRRCDRLLRFLRLIHAESHEERLLGRREGLLH